MVINELVKKYEKNRESYLSSEYNETMLRNDFLDSLFELLGWDIKNTQGKPTYEREVVLEESLKEEIGESVKKPDYTFRLFNERKFFVEAKKPSIRIEENNETAKQIRRYGWTAKLKISIISNFENLLIYDCSIKIDEEDNYKKALITKYHYSEYYEKFDELLNYVGKESVYTGNFDEVWKEIEEKIKKNSIDDLFLEQINNWRILLANEIYKYNQTISNEILNDYVQNYINRIIFLRVCEDRNIEKYQTLLNFATKEDFKALVDTFEKADRKYNAGLFEQFLSNKLIRNISSIFWTIIKELYYPEVPYSFSVLSSDILGSIYEIFLSEKLVIRDKNVVLEEKPETIDKDIISTPLYIINNIVKETLNPYLEYKNEEEIFNIKIADLACGSGSFLLEAYQLLNDNLIDYYLNNNPSKLIQTSINKYKIPFNTKKDILKNCIYGNDKDYTAVEVTKFGLLLKLLEDENTETINHNLPILPDLSKNINFGNSLISFEDIKNCENNKKNLINPFNFEKSKFDVIIGNPPYMKSEDMKNITPLEYPIYKDKYKTAYKQFDKYFLFIERGISLLKENGYLGYIVPNKFLKIGAGKKLRKFLSDNNYIKKIISFGANQVFKSKTTYTCLILIGKKYHKELEYYEVKDLYKWRSKAIRNDDYETIPISSLDEEIWVLAPAYLKGIYNKIFKQSVPFVDLIGEENIINGIQTSANDIYVITPFKEDEKYIYFENKGKRWKIEKELTKTYFKTSRDNINNLYTYRNFEPNALVIYPYKYNNGIEFINIKELEKYYPFAFKYFHNFKERLLNRDIKPEPKTPDEWYRYGRHQSLDKCSVPSKIIVGVLSLGNKYAIDFHGTFISSGGTAGYCMVVLPSDLPYSIYYIQAILNSKYLEWISSLHGEIFRGGYIARGTKVLNRLPIRIINFENSKEKNLHNEISKLQESLIDIQSKIDKNIKDPRILIKLKRNFKRIKSSLDNRIKSLYNLGEEDNLIPIISELYGNN